MAVKKAPGRFTLQFNMKDPQQQAATEILNQQGRTKAQFIASAVLHYVNCPETPDLPAGPVLMNNDELEQRVLMLVKKFFPHVTPEADTEFEEAESQPPQGATIATKSDGAFGGTELEAIYKTMAAFRGK